MSLLVLLIQLGAALGVGGAVLRAIDRDGAAQFALGRVLSLVVGIVLGAGLLATLFFVGACAGVMPAWLVRGILGAACLLLIREGHRVLDAARALRERCTGTLAVFDVVAVVMPCAVLFVLAWSPADMIDVWMYHLSAPREWLKQGGVVGFPYDIHSNLHLLGSMWYYGGLALVDDPFIAPKLTSVVAAIGVAAVFFVEVGRRGPLPLAALVAMVWLATGEMWEFATSAYIDVTLAFVVVLASTVLLRAAEAAPPVRARLALLAGSLLGIAAATKMSGYVFAPLLAGSWLLVVAIKTPSSQRATLWRDVAVMALAGLVFVAPWWARNAWTTGAPLYPYFVDWCPTRVEYLRVAREFRPDFGNFGLFGAGATASWQSTLGHLWLYLRNVENIDQNRLALGSVVALLVAALARRRDAEAHAASQVWLLIVALGSLAWLLSGAPRRFLLGPSALLLLVAAVRVADLGVWRGASAWRAGLVASIVLYVMAGAIKHRLAPYADGALPARANPGPGLYLTPAEMRRGLRDSTQGQAWIARIAALEPRGRVLTTEILPLTLQLDAPLLLNGPMHSANALRLAIEEEQLDAAGLAAWCARHNVSHILTTDPFDTPTLDAFRRDHLLALGTQDGLTLYELRTATTPDLRSGLDTLSLLHRNETSPPME